LPTGQGRGRLPIIHGPGSRALYQNERLVFEKD
jgi:hypothetical protein